MLSTEQVPAGRKRHVEPGSAATIGISTTRRRAAVDSARDRGPRLVSEWGKPAQALKLRTSNIPENVKHWHEVAKDAPGPSISRFEVPGEGAKTEWCEPVRTPITIARSKKEQAG